MLISSAVSLFVNFELRITFKEQGVFIGVALFILKLYYNDTNNEYGSNTSNTTKKTTFWKKRPR